MRLRAVPVNCCVIRLARMGRLDDGDDIIGPDERGYRLRSGNDIETRLYAAAPDAFGKAPARDTDGLVDVARDLRPVDRLPSLLKGA